MSRYDATAAPNSSCRHANQWARPPPAPALTNLANSNSAATVVRRAAAGVGSVTMEYRRLGSTGTIVSAQCLGAMTFGNESDEETAHAQLDLFVEHGGNFVDTADVYSLGHSEEIIGRWLATRPGMRDRLVIATKGRFAMGELPNDAGLSRTHLGRALEASLRRLGVDTIDLYQAHAWDPLTPIEETLGFFADAVRAGKIRYAGVSNFVGWQLQKAALLAGDAAPIVTLQPQYNLLVREIELEIVDVCRNEGIGILPWSPLAGGWLTGKYARDETPSGATRLGENPDRGMEAYGPRNAQERTWRIIDTVGKVAHGRGVSMPQVALAWIADRPAVTSVILGARTVAQLGDNLGAADLHLSEEETELLTEASTPHVSDYPYGPLGIDQRSRELGG
jgi:aryl-alcohol dehydrogenase-like predicted oxidoreductase